MMASIRGVGGPSGAQKLSATRRTAAGAAAKAPGTSAAGSVKKAKEPGKGTLVDVDG